MNIIVNGVAFSDRERHYSIILRNPSPERFAPGIMSVVRRQT